MNAPLCLQPKVQKPSLQYTQFQTRQRRRPARYCCWQTTASLVPLASVVPTFPRVGGQAARDWIGSAVETLPGFNGDDEVRLLLPDLVGLVDGRSVLTLSCLLLALVYWEGGILVGQWQERRRKQRKRDRGEPSADDEDAAAAAAAVAAAAEAEQARRPPLTPMERARYERRRGLGWLALLTASLVWCCGFVQGPSPFEP